MRNYSKSWMARNWLWAWPAGCFLPMLILVSGLWMIGSLTGSSLRGSTLYVDTVARVSEDPEVVDRLGTPVESLRLPRGELSSKEDGRGRLKIPVKGSKLEAIARVEAIRKGDTWRIEELIVYPADDSEPIELVTRPDADADESDDSDDEDDSSAGDDTE